MRTKEHGQRDNGRRWSDRNDIRQKKNKSRDRLGWKGGWEAFIQFQDGM